MRVLSLFDGISCARVALDRAKIPVTRYYASEIDRNAIAVSTKHYPDILRLGDVREVTSLPEPIDLLVGGSPCVDLSIAKKDRKGLAGEHSSLFWEYVRIWELLRPTYFILENVASMPKADRDIITKTMGVEPVMLDASLVSAQSRKRLFWTNIPVSPPADRGICLRDILQPDAEVDPSFTVNGKSFCLTASYHKAGTGEAEVEHNRAKKQRTMVKVATGLCYVGHLDGTTRKGMEGKEHLSRAHTQTTRVYSPEGKSPTLSASETSGRTHVVVAGRDVGRRLTADGTRADADTSLPYERRVEVREDDKTGTLTSVQKDNLIVSPHRVRKLTPVECERLQGLPDTYTEGVAKTHRYKALGNAFNVDIIAHILSGLRVKHEPHLTPLL